MKTKIKDILLLAFAPAEVEVIDESHTHAGHNHEARGGNTHFRVKIVSPVFGGKRLIDRHRMVYETLKSHQISYHALAITAKTPDEMKG